MSETQSFTTVRTVYRVAAALTLAAVAMGSVVCATESGAACPTWPGCYPDQVVPGTSVGPWIEFGHRLVAISSAPMVLAACWLSRSLPRRMRLARTLPWVALAGALAAGVFGMMIILFSLPLLLGVLDLCSALVAMTAMTAATVSLERPGARWAMEGLGAKLTWTAVATVIVMHLLGLLAAATGSYTRCMGWPLWKIVASDGHTALQWLRLVLAVASAVMVLGVAWFGLRAGQARASGVLIALFAVEMILGLVIGAAHLSRPMAAAYSVTAVLILWVLGLIGARHALVEHGEPHPAEPVTTAAAA